MKVRFGPAGIPLRCEDRSTIEGVKCCAALGMDAMEMEFVHGVRLTKEKAEQVKAVAVKQDIALSSHAPYYINLCSAEPQKEENSRRNIFQAAQATAWAGGTITVFHPGYYQKLSKEQAYEKAKKNLLEIEAMLKQEKVKIRLGAETVGKKSQFGGLAEVIKLAQELEMLVPVIDFSHIHARTDFPLKGIDDYRRLFSMLEKELPGYTQDFHSHFAEINYTEKGERNHLPLGTNNEPPYEPLMQMLAEQGYSGRIICETPQLDYDSEKMQKAYKRAL